jgi:hypothetical protein
MASAKPMGKVGSSSSANVNTSNKVGPQISPVDYNTLLAITALEDDRPQGRADVAQSLYNRILAANQYNVNFNQKRNSLKDLIIAPQQYEPTFSNTKDWVNISDRQSAAVAVMNSAKGKKYKWTLKDAMEQISATEAALKNPALQKQAQQHVGGRAYFLGTSQHKNMKPGDVLRGPKSNFFSPWYLEGTEYDQKRRNIPAPIPTTLLHQKQQAPPTQQKQQQSIPQRMFNFVEQKIKNLLPKKKYGGLISEFDGEKLPYAQDNILMRAEKNEYVVPRIAVEKIGLNVLDKISSLDPNFKMQRSVGSLTTPKPLSRNSYDSMPIVLPPITQGYGEANSSSTSGTDVPKFSASPNNTSAIDARSSLTKIYGIVG